MMKALFFVGLAILSTLAILALLPSLEASNLHYPPPSPHQSEPLESQWQNIVDVCVPYGLDPYLIAALVKIESWFDASAYNEAERRAYESGYPTWYGEYYGKGLMQLTGPWTGGVPFPSEVEWEYNMPPNSRPGEAPRMDNAYDARQNLNRGCWYFATLVDYYRGDINKALAAYNRGWQRVDDGSIDPDTLPYTRQVLDYYFQYQRDVGEYPRRGDNTTTTGRGEDSNGQNSNGGNSNRDDRERTPLERRQRIELLKAALEEPGEKLEQEVEAEARAVSNQAVLVEDDSTLSAISPSVESEFLSPVVKGGFIALLLMAGIFIGVFMMVKTAESK